ncbi:MAG: HEPN domain-containing protein [Armatimonadota bacterium]|nr:HEPN domain-containing protein [Armatimonadota bacterium]
MRHQTQMWLQIAERDLSAAEDLLATGHYEHVAHECQQAIEKTIKALLVEQTGRLPPRIHDLSRLAELAELDLDEERAQLFADLTELYVEVRYPTTEVTSLSEEEARGLLEATGEVREWLLSLLG